MSEISEPRETLIADIEDTEVFEVSMRTVHGEVIMSPNTARLVAADLMKAANDAEANLEAWVIDERERVAAVEDPVSDHTGPNLTIIDGSNAFMRAVNRVAKPTDGGDAA